MAKNRLRILREVKMTGQKLEPRQVRAYQCPECGHLTEDINKAIEHAEIPIDRLPLGFVYEGIFNPARVEGGYFNIIVASKVSASDHSVNHNIDSLYLTPLHQIGVIPSRNSADSIRDGIRDGSLKILNEGRYAEFQRVFRAGIRDITEKIGLAELVRTTPEINCLKISNRDDGKESP